MPLRVTRRGTSKRPFKTINTRTGRVEGSFSTRKAALRSQRRRNTNRRRP